MVGEREEAVAVRPRGSRHLLDRRLAVRRPVGVAVELADAGLRPRRAPAGCRCARPRARRRSRAARAGWARSRGSGRASSSSAKRCTSPVSTTVTPYSEIERPRRCASSRSATLWSFEPVKCWSRLAVVLGRHDAQVEPEALLRDDGRLRVAVRGDLEHPRQRDEVPDQRGRVGRGRDHVEVAEGLAPSADAPGARDLDRRRMGAELLDDLADDGKPDAEQPSPLRLRAEPLGERLEDPLLALRAEALERPHALLLGRHAQLLERRHAELAPDPRRRLRPEPREAQELPHLRRHLGPALLERGHRAGLRHLDDLRLDRRADPRQLLRRALRARAPRPTRPSRESASPRGGTRARGTPARRGSPTRPRARRARPRRLRCAAAAASADHRDGPAAGGAGRLRRWARAAHSSACRRTTSATTSRRSSVRSAR